MLRLQLILSLSFMVLVIPLQAQYAPAAGMPGTTAIHADSSIIQFWASKVQIQRGWVNVADTSMGLASHGKDSAALGKANIQVISLGDGGVATLQFEHPISNGPGWDFVVFENSFDGHYLELAHVEVSSDGQHFVRFPSHSLTPTQAQIPAFGTLDPTKLNNLAGKYKGMYGTPFDLEDFIMLSSVNINQITHIRIIDVVGSVQSAYGSMDTAGNFINDPWPTAFPSSGFDLDAVGVIHSPVNISSSEYKNPDAKITLYPNPCFGVLRIQVEDFHEVQNVELYSLDGRLLLQIKTIQNHTILDLQNFPSGIYFLRVNYQKRKQEVKKVVLK
jgi:hypothetical protein